MGFQWLLTLLLSAVAIPPMDSTQTALMPGGPDGFGYRWLSSDDQNGPSFDWIDATASGQGYQMGDDQTIWVPAQNFSFWFYGRVYSDSIAVSSNGWVSFTNSPSSFPYGLPDPIFGALLSAFGTDLGNYGGGYISVYVAQIDGKLVIEWLDAPHLDGGGTYTFEIILDPSDSSITFQYLTHTGAAWGSRITTTVGIQDELAEYYLPFSRYLLHDSLAVKFYYSPETDVVAEILHPSDNELVFVGQSDSVLVKVTNTGRTAATNVRLLCRVDSLDFVIFEDSATISILSNEDTLFFTFSSWMPNGKFNYRVTIEADVAYDVDPTNNYDTAFAKPTYLPEDSLFYFDGEVYGSIWRSSPFEEFGLEFHPDTLPYLIDYVAVWLVTPNDSGIPIPDTTIDPVIVRIWTGESIPTEQVFVDTVWRDDAPPGWVYAVPMDSIMIMDEKFWVSVTSCVNSTYGHEALGVDGALDHPEVKWIRTAGNWYQFAYEGNDPLIYVAGQGVEVPFRGDLEVEYVYPAWSYLLTPGVEESVVVKVKNHGPLSVWDGVVYCKIDSMDQPVFQSQIQLSGLDEDEETTVTFGTFNLAGDAPYPLTVWVHSDYDLVNDNDTIRDTLMAVVPANDTINFAEGDRVGAVWNSNLDEKFALELDLNLIFQPKLLAFWLISPGESLWPVPDTSLDPVVVEFWNGVSAPESLIYVDTVYRDNEQPGWVYSIPIDSIGFANGEKMWIVFDLCVEGADGCEGLAIDSTLDHPDAMWVYSQGNWTHSTFATGDPFVYVQLQEYGNVVEEIDSDSLVVRFGFVKNMPTIINSDLEIRFGLPENDVVSLKIYDIQGRVVRQILKNKALNAGYHSFNWSLFDTSGEHVPSGIYFIELKALRSGQREVKKLVVVR